MFGKNLKATSPKKLLEFFQAFIRLEAAGGIVLFAAAILALIIDNSSYAFWYRDFVIFDLTIFNLSKPLVLWINDGLMAIFFLLVGLEIKREVLEGELSSLAKAILPGVAAIGGVLGPAIIYYFINQHDATSLRGWGIPIATDIAFALGVLALLGSRVPAGLKIFLTALAIIDDLVAILIIAIFYTDELSWLSLGIGGLCLIVLCLLNYKKVTAFSPYAFVGILLWVCVLKSGVHATLAGVMVAMAYPLRSEKDPKEFPAHRVEKAIHPWVVFLVLPLFAFVNSGISFSTVSLNLFLSPLYLGIAVGLFFGKQLGVMLATFLAVKFNLAKLPTGARWAHIYGISLVCGVGFTMSLFIGSLAFDENMLDSTQTIRLGVLTGSLLSGLFGYLFLRFLPGKRK